MPACPVPDKYQHWTPNLNSDAHLFVHPPGLSPPISLSLLSHQPFFLGLLCHKLLFLLPPDFLCGLHVHKSLGLVIGLCCSLVNLCLHLITKHLWWVDQHPWPTS